MLEHYDDYERNYAMFLGYFMILLALFGKNQIKLM